MPAILYIYRWICLCQFPLTIYFTTTNVSCLLEMTNAVIKPWIEITDIHSDEHFYFTHLPSRHLVLLQYFELEDEAGASTRIFLSKYLVDLIESSNCWHVIALHLLTS